jgi:uncharacterized protein with PIN domain
MNRLQIWWIHFKLVFLGDKKYEKAGGGMIPCEDCGKLFWSYDHWDYYDNLCESCLKIKEDKENGK